MFRFLFLNHTSKLGGAERSLIDFVTYIKEKQEIYGIEPYLIVNENGELVDILSRIMTVDIISDISEFNREFGVIYNLRKILNVKFFKFLLNFRKKILGIQPDLIYINSLRSLFYWSLLTRTLTIKPKVIYSVRDILSKEFMSSLNLFILKSFLLKNVDLYICNSFYTAEVLEKLIGEREKIEVIYNPAPRINTLNTDKARNFLKGKICYFEDKILIASFSRISPWKNQEIILDSLSHIPEKVLNDICILFFGDALFGEYGYKRYFLRRIKDVSQKLPVYYIGNVSDPLSFMALCDIILHTSKKPEPFGRIIVEGMSLGKIVISSGIGGAGELIKDGVNGFIFSPDSPQDLAKKLVRAVKLIQSKKDNEIKKNAIITAVKLDREVLFSKKIKILKNLLN